MECPICSFLPCLCVTEIEAKQAQKVSELREMLQHTSTVCDFCLMLPCLCEMEHSEDDKVDTEMSSTPEIVNQQDTTEIDLFGCVPLISSTDKNRDDCQRKGNVVTEENSAKVWVAAEIALQLKPHQVEGVLYLAHHIRNDQGCILADYMGLGKTLQLITTIHSYIIDGHRMYGITL